MAIATWSSHSLFSFLFLFFLLVSTEMPMVEAKICQRRSKTWSGLFCGNSRHCDNQCDKWVSAEHGACHAQFPGVASFCYFKCQVSSTGFRQQPENHHVCVLSVSD